MMISKRFLIYERYEGTMDFSNKIKEFTRFKYDENFNENIYTALEAVFYKSCNEEFPVIVCDIKINPQITMSWSKEKLSSCVQRSLHVGICLSRDILSKDDSYFVFYRHGNDIFNWIREGKE